MTDKDEQDEKIGWGDEEYYDENYKDEDIYEEEKETYPIIKNITKQNQVNCRKSKNAPVAGRNY